MFFVGLLLMTLWLASVVVGFTLGGLIHLLVLSAVLVVFMSGNHEHRHA